MLKKGVQRACFLIIIPITIGFIGKDKNKILILVYIIAILLYLPVNKLLKHIIGKPTSSY